MFLFANYPSWIHPEIFPGVPVLGLLRWYGLMYIFAFGTAALFLKSGSALLCALGALLAVVTAAFLWMMKIQRGFQKLLPKK